MNSESVKEKKVKLNEQKKIVSEGAKRIQNRLREIQEQKAQKKEVVPVKRGIREQPQMVTEEERRMYEQVKQVVAERVRRRESDGMNATAEEMAKIAERVEGVVTEVPKNVDHAIERVPKMVGELISKPTEKNESSESKMEQEEKLNNENLGFKDLKPQLIKNTDITEIRRRKGTLESNESIKPCNIELGDELAEFPEKLTSVHEFHEIFQKEFLESDIIRQGYGVLVPLDVIKEGGLSDLLCKTDAFENFSLKNPEIGVLIDQIRKKFKLTYRQTKEVLGLNVGYVKSGGGVRLIQLVSLPTIEFIRKGLSFVEIERLKKKIEEILISKGTIIQISGSKSEVSFCPERLRRLKIGNREYVILPRGKWEVHEFRDHFVNWIKGFKNSKGRAPTANEIKAKFGGILSFNKKIYNKSLNNLLKEYGIAPNRERNFDWSDPTNLEAVKKYIINFHNKNGRTPTIAECTKEFSEGFRRSLRKPYNEFLKEDCRVLPSHEKKFDWLNPASFEVVKKYITDFYKKFRRAPTQNECAKKFSTAFRLNLGKPYNEFLKEDCGVPPVHEMKCDWSDIRSFIEAKKFVLDYYQKHKKAPTAREFNKKYSGLLKYKNYNDFLKEECKVPVSDLEKSQIEGYLFDKLSKRAFKIINKKNTTGFHIFHPKMKEYGHDHVIPDIVKHDLGKNPLKKIGAQIFLEEKQKIDEIIEFKRTYGAISTKDWELYTIIAKRMKIYLLKGNSEITSFKKNGCIISFHSKDELIEELKSKKKPFNKAKIESLIKDIHALDKRIDPKTQSSVNDF